ncbi:MAG: hypothetical protein AAF702_15275 [Chloroflexota bacterium]
MFEHMLAFALEWLEERTKPLFVVAALLAYGFEIYSIMAVMNPLNDLNFFLIEALSALTTPFSIILLQEMLELVAKISESNLLSARHQFEIVLLVIVRSFFKSFSKVNGYVAEGEFSPTVQEAVVKVFAIIILMAMIYFFRVMSDSKYLNWYSEQGERSNLYKQALVVVLVIFALVYQIAYARSFNVFDFVSLIFTGLIVIEALFLILAIAKGDFGRLVLESSLVIALIFARFPLFASNTLSYILSVIGVAFATASLYLYYRVSIRMQENRQAAEATASGD